MHIPDGYLSPSTCATLYAASAPFWYVAVRRVQNVLNTRTVPLLSVFSAFSFAVMMFNLPLPGGTTGHAVGMGMAAIVLGPWFSILAISTALLVQMLLFGDGGVTAFGANCFNMAIVGSIAAYGVYRLVARGAALSSMRRVVAAGLAGYIAINLSALCAAIEFGLQPRFFHDAAGAPLYAPYPLHIAVPAMLLGHLTFAGLAELVLSAGLVAYLQRADPALLRMTAPRAPEGEKAAPQSDGFVRWPTSRRLWVILGLVLMLTPLGILAGGSAWGEWRAGDFADPAARQHMTDASGHHAPPREAPRGLTRLSSIWAAPLANYAPSFIRDAKLGYFVSALAGAGIVILLATVIVPFAGKLHSGNRVRPGFLEKSLDNFARLSEEALFAENVARSRGLLQTFDPRVKLAGLGTLLIAAIAIHRLPVLVALFLGSILLVFLSRIPVRAAVRAWLAVMTFTGCIALPALFLTPGNSVARVPFFNWPVTDHGLSAAAFLVLRAETAATLALALVLTTPWNRLLRALRILQVPAAIVLVLQMTYRYLFVFLQAARDLMEARRARLLGPLDPARQRTTASALAGALLAKSLALSSDVHLAMLARGFRGEVYLLDDLAMNARDWLTLAFILSLSAVIMLIGR